MNDGVIRKILQNENTVRLVESVLDQSVVKVGVTFHRTAKFVPLYQ
jgi:hypothetical protein